MQNQIQSPMETLTEKRPITSYTYIKLGQNFPEKRTPISHPSASSTSDPDFPTIHCRCGAGLCHIRVAASLKNPGRKYYRCPGKFDKHCEYFKWCDNLREDEVRKSQPEINFPACLCGAGVCTVRVQESGPHKGRSFFACPIKKGDGACSFKQWLDESSSSSSHSELFIPEDESEEESSLLDEFDLSYEEEMQIEAIEMRPHESQQVENITEQNRLHLELTTEKRVNDSAVENAQQSVTQVAANIHNASPDYASSSPFAIPEEDTSKDGLDYLNKGPTIMSSTILETFENSSPYLQNKLVTVLESMDPKDHEAMSNEANRTFTTLDHLKIVDYELFHLQVTEYINQAAILACIEKTINETAPSEDLINRYKTEKTHFDETFRAYCDVNNTYIATSERLKTLRKDASYLRDLLGELEKELRFYEAENVKEQSNLNRISKTMSECKVSFREATESLYELDKREIERSAAKAAFETAKAQLRRH